MPSQAPQWGVVFDNPGGTRAEPVGEPPRCRSRAPESDGCTGTETPANLTGGPGGGAFWPSPALGGAGQSATRPRRTFGSFSCVRKGTPAERVPAGGKKRKTVCRDETRRPWPFQGYAPPGAPWGRRRLAGLVAPGHSPPGEPPRCRSPTPEREACTPTDAPAMGPPPKPSVSGFGGERTSKGAGEVFAVLLAETKPSGLCEDDWGFSGGGKPGELAPFAGSTRLDSP